MTQRHVDMIRSGQIVVDLEDEILKLQVFGDDGSDEEAEGIQAEVKQEPLDEAEVIQAEVKQEPLDEEQNIEEANLSQAADETQSVVTETQEQPAQVEVRSTFLVLKLEIIEEDSSESNEEREDNKNLDDDETRIPGTSAATTNETRIPTTSAATSNEARFPGTSNEAPLPTSILIEELDDDEDSSDDEAPLPNSILIEELEDDKDSDDDEVRAPKRALRRSIIQEINPLPQEPKIPRPIIRVINPVALQKTDIQCRSTTTNPQLLTPRWYDMPSPGPTLDNSQGSQVWLSDQGPQYPRPGSQSPAEPGPQSPPQLPTPRWYYDMPSPGPTSDNSQPTSPTSPPIIWDQPDQPVPSPYLEPISLTSAPASPTSPPNFRDQPDQPGPSHYTEDPPLDEIIIDTNETTLHPTLAWNIRIRINEVATHSPPLRTRQQQGESQPSTSTTPLRSIIQLHVSGHTPPKRRKIDYEQNTDIIDLVSSEED